MTLIINAVWGPWAFHASDRFVSVPVSQRNPTGEFDPNSNKSVTVIGSDCWLVMGYTGLAYLNGRPTDQLIAEAISGHPDLSGVMYAGWFPAKRPHYREIRNRIEHAMNDAYNKLSPTAKKYNTTIIGCGLQRKSKRIKRVMFRIDVSQTGSVAAETADPILPWSGMQIAATGTVHFPTMDAMGERLKTYTDNGGNDPKAFREILLDAVRATGKIVPTAVGQDAMGVYLDNMNQTISAHFHPENVSQLNKFLQSAKGFDPSFAERPSVPTPFVLSPGAIWGPSVGNPGGWSMTTNGGHSINYEFTGFNTESGPGSVYMSAQPRRLPP